MTSSKFCVLEEYRRWVVNNVEILSQFETLGRMGSYIIAGRFKKSAVLSEFLYSLTNIVVFVNDQIIIRALKEPDEFKGGDTLCLILEKCRYILTILEYLQVFLEISAVKLWGTSGKWIVVGAIQTIKFLWRILIIASQRVGLSAIRPIPSLDRKSLKIECDNEKLKHLGFNHLDVLTFSLKSGRVIRHFKGAPSIQKRSWDLPTPIKTYKNSKVKNRIKCSALVGEVLHVGRPIFHLLTMWKFGLNSWISWCFAIVVEILSLNLVKSDELIGDDRKEFHRRQLALLMFLLRSPFYDTFSRTVILLTLKYVEKLPVIRLIPNQIVKYLLYWQNIYFYVWD